MALVREPCADLLEEVALARTSNEASGTLVPTTLVDDAALVWRLREAGFTQEQVGEALRWNRVQVAQYQALQKICRDAWEVVVTTFTPPFPAEHEDVGTATVPGVTSSPFTENLLRAILDLTPAQQLLLCTKLAKGTDGKGHKYTKSDFKTEAQRYTAYNGLEAQALTEARSFPEVKQVRDMAEALRQYARQQAESLAIQNAAAEIKLRAERRAGELLQDMDKAKGGNPNLSHHVTGSAPTYRDLDIERMQAHRWQQIATLSPATFETYITETKAQAQELTSAGALRLAREARKADAFPVLADGHHRYAICTRLGLDYAVNDWTLQGKRREEVWNWIIDNQLGRRNLSEERQSYLRGKRYNGEKKAEGAPSGNQNAAKQLYHDDTVVSETTREWLGAQYGVSQATIARDGAFAAAVDTLAEQVRPDLREAVLAPPEPATPKPTKKQVTRLGTLAEQVRPGLRLSLAWIDLHSRRSRIIRREEKAACTILLQLGDQRYLFAQT